MPNKALSSSLCLGFFSEKECLTLKVGLEWILRHLTALGPSLFLYFGGPWHTLAFSVAGYHSNQQSPEAQLPFWNLKAAGLFPINL